MTENVNVNENIVFIYDYQDFRKKLLSVYERITIEDQSLNTKANSTTPSVIHFVKESEENPRLKFPMLLVRVCVVKDREKQVDTVHFFKLDSDVSEKFNTFCLKRKEAKRLRNQQSEQSSKG